MIDEKQIEEMAEDLETSYREQKEYPTYEGMADILFTNLNYRKIPEGAVVIEQEEYDALKQIESYHIKSCGKGSVVLTREEYEKLKSLYDSQQGAIMTSSIGDLPLTVEGLRKAVDEITRLINVQVELQELNAEYYNEAKDLRRELKQTHKETARKFLNMIYWKAVKHIKGKNKDECFIEISFEKLDELAKQYGVEV